MRGAHGMNQSGAYNGNSHPLRDVCLNQEPEASDEVADHWGNSGIPQTEATFWDCWGVLSLGFCLPESNPSIYQVRVLPGVRGRTMSAALTFGGSALDLSIHQLSPYLLSENWVWRTGITNRWLTWFHCRRSASWAIQWKMFWYSLAFHTATGTETWLPSLPINLARSEWVFCKINATASHCFGFLWILLNKYHLVRYPALPAYTVFPWDSLSLSLEQGWWPGSHRNLLFLLSTARGLQADSRSHLGCYIHPGDKSSNPRLCTSSSLPHQAVSPSSQKFLTTV